MDFMKMTIDDIIKWCQENNQVAWLKEEAAQVVKVKVYPRHKIEKTYTKKDGTTYTRLVSVADKSQPYTLEEHPITFPQIKSDFANKFMPDLIKNKEPKTPSIQELIAAL